MTETEVHDLFFKLSESKKTPNFQTILIATNHNEVLAGHIAFAMPFLITAQDMLDIKIEYGNIAPDAELKQYFLDAAIGSIVTGYRLTCAQPSQDTSEEICKESNYIQDKLTRLYAYYGMPPLAALSLEGIHDYDLLNTVQALSRFTGKYKETLKNLEITKRFELGLLLIQDRSLEPLKNLTTRPCPAANDAENWFNHISTKLKNGESIRAIKQPQGQALTLGYNHTKNNNKNNNDDVKNTSTPLLKNN